MWMNKRSQLAITAMVEVALHQATGPVPLVAIQSRHNMPKTRLEQIFSQLRHAQLVNGRLGPGGGYSLAVGSEEISLADIVMAVEPWVEQAELKEGTPVHHRFWQELNQKIMQDLKAISLGQLVSSQKLQSGHLGGGASSDEGFLAVRPNSPDMPLCPVPSVISAS
jgi:Rrf2 family iron-sulfur cluster assembly transcriptional regulator